MEQRDLGNTGLKVSALGFGCGSVGGLMVRADPAEQTRAVARALEAGLNYFDTAPAYGNGRSEENLGRVLSELGAWDQVIVGTKVRLALSDVAEPSVVIRRSLERSLRLLGRDSVDLLQLHNHIGLAAAETNDTLDLADVIGEVAEGLKEMRRDGLCRFIGFTGLGDTPALDEAVLADDFETVQAYFNVINPSAGYTGDCGDEQDFEGLINTAARAGLGVIAIRVLAAGALTGNLERHPVAGPVSNTLAGGAEYDRDVERAKRLPAIVAELGLENPFELAIRFALAKEGISTILAGMSEYAHLENFIRWTERGPLPPDLARRLVDEAF